MLFTNSNIPAVSTQNRVIFNADDFGRSESVNAAVLLAHSEGVLSSASLMVSGQAANEAVALAKEHPELAVGLHLTLSHASAILGHDSIPSLVNSNGRFRSDPVIAGLFYSLNKEARAQLSAEIEAQFRKFSETGLPLSHVDGHQHLHAHPVILPIVVEIAAKYGACGIRIPREPFRLNMRSDASRALYKLAMRLSQKYMEKVCAKGLAGSSLLTCDVSIGSLMSGKMHDDYVIKMLSGFDYGSVEVYFHPDKESSRGERYGPNSGDLRALTSRKLKEFLRLSHYEITTYAGLK